MLNQSCIPGLIPTWSRFMILFICCYIQFVNILFRNFTGIIIRDIGVWFSYSIFDFLCQFLFSISFSSTLSSVQSLMTDSLQPHGLQHARVSCPSPTPWACSNSCPLNWWCHPAILSSLVPFSSCLQSFSPSGSFPMSQFFTSGSQNSGYTKHWTQLENKNTDAFFKSTCITCSKDSVLDHL